MHSPGGRYLVITELFLPTKGGTAVWFDEVYRRLGGRQIHILTAEVTGGAEHDRKHPNRVHRLRLRRYRWLRPESLGIYAKFLVASIATALRHRFDAVHAGRVLPEGLVGWVVARLIRRPLVVYSHGEELTTWRQPRKMRAMTWTYRRADRVIANSEFTRDELVKLGIDGSKIVLLNPGVDIERFCPGLRCEDLRAQIGLGAADKLILSVGRLSRRKGFDRVIQALPALQKGAVRIHHAIIGIGEDRQYLETLAAQLGVAELLHFLGHVEPVDLPRWYNAADVVAMPNREIDGDTEGFGMVYLEAAACGKPAIAGLAGGTAAAVVHGTTGLRVDGEQTEAVAAALDLLLTRADMARELGERGRARVLDGFSWQHVAERTRALHVKG